MRLAGQTQRRARIFVVAHVRELRQRVIGAGAAGTHEWSNVGRIQPATRRENAHAPIAFFGRRGAIPVVVGVRAVAVIVDEVIAGIEVYRPVEQPVLLGTAGMLGLLVTHRPDALVLLLVDDPRVVGHLVAGTFAQGVDVDVHRTP